MFVLAFTFGLILISKEVAIMLLLDSSKIRLHLQIVLPRKSGSDLFAAKQESIVIFSNVRLTLLGTQKFHDDAKVEVLVYEVVRSSEIIQVRVICLLGVELNNAAVVLLRIVRLYPSHYFRQSAPIILLRFRPQHVGGISRMCLGGEEVSGQGPNLAGYKCSS